MRRIVLLAVMLLLLTTLAFGVSAETGATQVSCQASVYTDESCDMVVTANIHLDAPVEKLTFPLPAEASSITLNGSRVGSSLTTEARLVDLSGITGGMSGDFTATFTYHLTDVVDTNEAGLLELKLPLLSGFAYPVEKLGFTVTMPGRIAYKPAFSSGYHQSTIEETLIFSYSENSITGTSAKALKDRETLSMTLTVTEEMFPQAAIQLQALEPYYLIMGICGGLALLYWLLFLRTLPPRLLTVTAPPQGYSAGQLPSLITLQGVNLTAMVLSWAQLGYLSIQIGKGDRVLLYQQMEMGNERNAFEQRCFQKVFGNRSMVDTSGFRYSLLCQSLAGKTGHLQGLVHPRSGSKQVFRALMALVGAACGICLGLTLSVEAAVPWLPTIGVALFCGIGSWFIQQWAECLYSQNKNKLLLSLLLCVVWAVMAIMAGTQALDLWILLAQLLAGLMATFGGRRTEAGRQLMSEALGFRRYLCTIPRAQLQHIRRRNPDYFHDLAPYALALGCDKAFANRFGRDLIPPCPYLSGVPQKPMPAAEWSFFLRRTALLMEARLRQMPLEKLSGFFRNLTR